MADLASELHPFAESLLEPGEELLGACVASQQRRFKGWMVAVAVTPERIVIQRMARGREFKGEGRAAVAAAGGHRRREGAEGRTSGAPTAPIMDRATVELKISTTGGEKMKLMLMRSGKALGIGAGADIQAEGVESLARWFEEGGGSL